MTKKCSKCGLEREISYFPKNKKAPDGLSYWCKSCNRAYCLNWKQAHPKERKIYDQAYNLAHKEERRAYVEANKEKIQAYLKEYKTLNKQYLREVERLRRQKIRAKRERKQIKDTKLEIENVQLSLINT